MREAGGDAAHVGLRFGEGRNTAVACDRFRTGIISGEGQAHVSAIALEKVLQVVRSGVNILRGIEDVGDGIMCSGFGKQLHEPESLLARDGAGIEIRFFGDDAGDQILIHAMLCCGRMNQLEVWYRHGRGRRGRNGCEDVLGFNRGDIGGGHIDNAAGDRQSNAVALQLIAGDVQSDAGFENGIIGARGGSSQCRREDGEMERNT